MNVMDLAEVEVEVDMATPDDFICNFPKKDFELYTRTITRYREMYPHPDVKFFITADAYAGIKEGYRKLPDQNALFIKGIPNSLIKFWKILDSLR